MPSCPECENELDIEIDEVEEGDVVACEECGTEYEVVGVEPLELARVEEGLEEEDELLKRTTRRSKNEPGKLAGSGGLRLLGVGGGFRRAAERAVCAGCRAGAKISAIAQCRAPC